MAVPVSEKGSVTSRHHLWWANLEDDEQTPEMRWPESIAVLNQMRRQESQISTVLRAVALPVRRTSWSIDGSGCRPEVTALVAEDLGLPVLGQAVASPIRLRDRFSWGRHLRLALTMLPFGHAFFEQVYRLDGDAYRLRKLGWRPPQTITKVDVAADGGLVAIEQGEGIDGKGVRIGVERLVAYTLEQEGGNWLGQSLLRPAYKYWLLKDQMLRVGAQTVHRNGMGVPIYTAGKQPEGITLEDYKAREEAELEAGFEIASGFRGGEASGAAIRNGATLRLAGVEGKLSDALPWVRYYDEQMAKAALAHFLTLGGDNATGSYNLAETFARAFSDSIQTIAQDVCDVTNQHVIEDLVDVNFGPTEPAPRLVFEEVGAQHPATAEAIKALVDADVLTPDGGLEAHVRRTRGLPALDPDTTRDPERKAPDA